MARRRAGRAEHARAREAPGERKAPVLAEKTRDTEMREEEAEEEEGGGGEGAADLFHSCKRCACNANSLHPSRWAEAAEAVWRERASTAAAVIPHLTSPAHEGERGRAGEEVSAKTWLRFNSMTRSWTRDLVFLRVGFFV